VRELPGHLDDDDGAGGARLATALLDLLTVAVAAEVDRRSAVPPDARRRARLGRIYASIDARLGDPDLTPATIAATHHISVRYLHLLFETEQHSVADLIRTPPGTLPPRPARPNPRRPACRRHRRTLGISEHRPLQPAVP